MRVRVTSQNGTEVLPNEVMYSLFADMWKKYTGGCNGIKLDLNRCLQQEASLTERLLWGAIIYNRIY